MDDVPNRLQFGGETTSTSATASDRSRTVSASPRRSGWVWSRSKWRVLLVGWWGLMFIATHIPVGPSIGESPVPDKLIHFLVFAVLGVLLPQWHGRDVRLTLRRASMLFLVMVTYGAVDELLQIPVGRSAEWWDWIADVAGGASGLLLAAGWRQLAGG